MFPKYIKNFGHKANITFYPSTVFFGIFGATYVRRRVWKVFEAECLAPTLKHWELVLACSFATGPKDMFLCQGIMNLAHMYVTAINC